jgi:hypothetical protein
MFFVISGAALVGTGSASFWYLLPRHGRVHPFVQNSDVGSMVTIGIMTVVTFGLVILFAGLSG